MKGRCSNETTKSCVEILKTSQQLKKSRPLCRIRYPAACHNSKSDNKSNKCYLRWVDLKTYIVLQFIGTIERLRQPIVIFEVTFHFKRIDFNVRLLG